MSDYKFVLHEYLDDGQIVRGMLVELNHSHWAQVNDDGWPIAKEDAGVPNWREAPPVVTAVKDKVRADQ